MIEADFSTYIPSFLSSPSPGRSSQWEPQPGSARWRLDGAAGGQRAALAWDRPALDVLDDDLFSMSWHISRLLWLTDSLADVFFLAGFRCAVTSPRSVWRLPLALRSVSPTTFYPCGLPRPSPDALCVFRRLWKAQRRRPHLYDGVLRRPGICSGRLHQHQSLDVTLHCQSVYPSFSTAPTGITPVSRKRQSAMSNLRATATIPIRRKRLPPLPKRSRNQTLRALSG
jgi:hypothetical protein